MTKKNEETKEQPANDESLEKATTEEGAVKAESEKKPSPSEKPAKSASSTEKPKAEKDEPSAEPKVQKEVARRGRKGKHIPKGIAYIKATFNNTLVSIADSQGNIISWSSGGRCGFKGSRKSTAFAATAVAREAARGAVKLGMSEISVELQGPGAGRESAVRSLQAAGLTVGVLKDTTGVPHNGCRPPKRRRV